MQIHFHTFRHWKATTEQHNTRDPWYVKMILGHKSIKSTETYIHLEKMIYQGKANDQFTVKVADTLEEAIKLMEVGFEYHAEIEGHKLFRKRNDIMDNSQIYGIISHPLYFINSKSCCLTFPFSITCSMRGSCVLIAATSSRTVLQTKS